MDTYLNEEFEDDPENGRYGIVSFAVPISGTWGNDYHVSEDDAIMYGLITNLTTFNSKFTMTSSAASMANNDFMNKEFTVKAWAWDFQQGYLQYSNNYHDDPGHGFDGYWASNFQTAWDDDAVPFTYTKYASFACVFTYDDAMGSSQVIHWPDSCGTQWDDVVITPVAGSISPPLSITTPIAGTGPKKVVVPNRYGNIENGTLFALGAKDSFNDTVKTRWYRTDTGENDVAVSRNLRQEFEDVADNETEFDATVNNLNFTANLTVVDTSGVFTLTGSGFNALNLTSGMEIELTAGTGSSHDNDGKIFLISSVSDTSIQINPAVNNPYTGLSAPVAQSAKNYDVEVGGFTIQDVSIHPANIGTFAVNGEVTTNKVNIYEFNNASTDDNILTSNSTSNFKLITKELDLGDIGELKNLHKIYITHNDTVNVDVSYKVSQPEGTGQWTTILSGIDLDSSIENAISATVPYECYQKNIRTVQFKIEARNTLSNYELNDITLVYRTKRPR
jgi:hypothetical protein